MLLFKPLRARSPKKNRLQNGVRDRDLCQNVEDLNDWGAIPNAIKQRRKATLLLPMIASLKVGASPTTPFVPKRNYAM
jgi:hypothetical protein